MEKIKRTQPKFKTAFLKRAAPKNVRLKKLAYWCAQFHRNDLAPCYGKGSYGNLSFRVNKLRDEFIITASGLRMKENLKNSSFFRVTDVDVKKRQVSGYGLKPPSSESLLHFVIYKKRKDAGAIFHGHCAELLKNARLCGIPQTSKEEPYGTTALVKRVLKILGRNQSVIMKNHGFITLGKGMDEAGERALANLALIKKVKAFL